LAMRKSPASCMQASHDGAAICQSVRVGQPFNYPLWKEMYPDNTYNKSTITSMNANNYTNKIPFLLKMD